MLYIFSCMPVSSPDIGQSGTCPQLVCSSLSAFPGTSGLIARLLNNPHSNLSQLKLTYVSLFTEHFWTRWMKSHPFDAVALLFLSSPLLHKSWCSASTGLGIGSWFCICWLGQKKEVELSCASSYYLSFSCLPHPSADFFFFFWASICCWDPVKSRDSTWCFLLDLSIARLWHS